VAPWARLGGNTGNTSPTATLPTHFTDPMYRDPRGPFVAKTDRHAADVPAPTGKRSNSALKRAMFLERTVSLDEAGPGKEGKERASSDSVIAFLDSPPVAVPSRDMEEDSHFLGDWIPGEAAAELAAASKQGRARGAERYAHEENGKHVDKSQKLVDSFASMDVSSPTSVVGLSAEQFAKDFPPLGPSHKWPATNLSAKMAVDGMLDEHMVIDGPASYSEA